MNVKKGVLMMVMGLVMLGGCAHYEVLSHYSASSLSRDPLRIYVEPARNLTASVVYTSDITRAFQNTLAQDGRVILTVDDAQSDYVMRIFLVQSRREQHEQGLFLPLQDGKKKEERVTEEEPAEERVSVQESVRQRPRRFALKERAFYALTVQIWELKSGRKVMDRSVSLEDSYPILDALAPVTSQSLRYDTISRRFLRSMMSDLATQVLAGFYAQLP